jgi:methylated-DNA-[protein]-cysteine S-methyltransferase
VRWTSITTVIGNLGVAVDEIGVCAVRFGGPGGLVEAEPTGLLADAAAQLRDYFAGERTEFEVPLSVRGGSPFERDVWVEISKIEYGETNSYGKIAASVGDPGAAQAVGTACNHNPLPVIVPCHRVIGADGKLVGFGGGLPRKRALLQLEARIRIERDFAV